MYSDTNPNGVLTREQRDKLVLDLYFKENKTYSEIAKIARISPRDIKPIIDKASQEKERQAHKSLAVQAYELFSKGKTLLEVTIDLNLGQAQATGYYGEYLKLVGLDNITKIYMEFQGDTSYFVELCKEAKAAKMGVSQVVNLLRIANNYLPSVEHRYGELQEENNFLDSILPIKRKEIQDLSNYTTHMSKRLDTFKSECEKESAVLHDLIYQSAKLHTFVNNFKNNDPTYIKFVKTIRDEILRILSEKKALLSLAVLSIAESIRNNPDKYMSLVTNPNDNFNPSPSMATTIYDPRPACSHDMYQPLHVEEQQHFYLLHNNRANMLIDEAHKLYSFLTERFLCDIVNENVSKQSIPAEDLSAAVSPSEQGRGGDDNKQNHV